MPDSLNRGVTANDGPGDADAGGNGSQNFPVLDAVAVVGASTWIGGRLDSAAATTFRIELFDATADPAGHGEGRVLIGSFDVTTGGSGEVSFFQSIPGSALAGAP